MADEQAYKFLQRNIEELQRTLRVLAALEEYFKSESPARSKPRVRGVRVEITTIKGAVIKANQKKHEYVAQTRGARADEAPRHQGSRPLKPRRQA